ncbi:hypothetical protein KP509_04G097300 [Ceratopteris richardii]|uniref:BHLH domain-containing protein n=1 Tax=Ceratopteris richardii TaxID=49495 RepID=A0A8T2V2R0_CERRI|nr:hypothetical protein KP509_04G097300 [Ceratopteris richardii]
MKYLAAAVKKSDWSCAIPNAERKRKTREDEDAIACSSKRRKYLSFDPQSVAARERRGRIRQKLQTLRQLVLEGSTMDTASMLDEAYGIALTHSNTYPQVFHEIRLKSSLGEGVL